MRRAAGRGGFLIFSYLGVSFRLFFVFFFSILCFLLYFANITEACSVAPLVELPLSQQAAPDEPPTAEDEALATATHPELRPRSGGQATSSDPEPRPGCAQQPVSPPRTPHVGTSKASSAWSTDLTGGSASASSSAPASSSSESHRRLKRKSAAQGVYEDSSAWASSVNFAEAMAAEVEEVRQEAKEPIPTVGDPQQTHEAMRRFYVTEQLEKERKVDPEAQVRTLRGKLRLGFAKLTVKQRQALALRAAEKEANLELKADLQARASLYDLQLEEASHKPAVTLKWLDSKSFLLTWQHKSWSWRPPTPFANLSEALTALRSDARAIAIWDKFRTSQQATQAQLRLAALTLSAEVCTESFEACGRAEVKVHFHAFGHAVGKVRVRTAQEGGHVFWGVRPDNNAIPGIVFRGDRAGASKKDDSGLYWAGHYYLCCEAKLGLVWSWSSKRVFKDYRVRPQWITAWLSVGASSINIHIQLCLN